IPKQYMSLGGRPAIAWSVAAFAEAGAGEIVIVCAREHAGLCRGATAGGPPVRIVDGGATRTASVRAGLSVVGDAEAILIHDAARPGLSASIVHALVAALEAGASAVAPALAVPDTLRRTDGAGRIVEDIRREGAMR